MNLMRSTGKLVRTVVLFSALSPALLAGEFYEKDGAAIKGFDPVAYFKEGKPHEGSKDITATYKGSVFRFATVDNRATFEKDPEKYAPQYNGFCAFGVSKGVKAKIEPDQFAIVDDKLYLNYDKDIATKWNKDKSKLITKANANWQTVSKIEKVVE